MALSDEDLGWAQFTCAPETYEEIAHKLSCMKRTGSNPMRMISYVDGLLETPLRMNTSKVVSWRLGSTPRIMSEPDFHVALQSIADLYRSWVAGLRLAVGAPDVDSATHMTEELLRLSAPSERRG